LVGWLSGFRTQTGSVAYWRYATFARRLGEGTCGNTHISFHLFLLFSPPFRLRALLPLSAHQSVHRPSQPIFSPPLVVTGRPRPLLLSLVKDPRTKIGRNNSSIRHQSNTNTRSLSLSHSGLCSPLQSGVVPSFLM